MDKGILRIIDANQNRLLEGLRVCEEITRFIILDKRLTLNFKNLRHNVTDLTKKWKIKDIHLLDSRDSLKDIGKPSIKEELKRRNCQDIFFANIQRAKESARVLEEFSKLENKRISAGFKDIRYRLYQIEKNSDSKIRNIRGN
ncbi:MAG TPA: thiamine-phosphate pyrophosphorylase [Candidatus Omnitrophica bacterium]|nr:thiamine-phosphate pyrophosphorylase [Candidatus Omnitrophota bacterium]